MITFKQFIKEQAATTENGYMHFDWAKDFGDQSYIPATASHDKVLELHSLQPKPGRFKALMKDFLATQEAGQADMIYIDPAPGEEEQYKAAGFRSKSKDDKRLWLIKKGSPPTDVPAA